MFPHRRVENARVVHVHRKLGRTGLVVNVQNRFPGRAAIDRLVNASLFRSAVQRALSRDQDDVGILRIDDDARDVLRRFEPDPLPRLAGVSRFVDAIAVVRHHAAHCVFAHADVNNVRVAFRNSHSADGTGLEVAVGDVAPTDAHVVCFPETAASRSHVVSLRIADNATAGDGTSPAKWTNRTPLQRFENGVVIIGLLGCKAAGTQADKKDGEKGLGHGADDNRNTRT